MLSLGTRLGPYEIVGSLGSGGMGEVYRARDTALHRQVAIKILPNAFANDPDRQTRFEREARTLALLNHPHIAAIYGLESGTGLRGIVLELVEGETLLERVRRGLRVTESLELARQIAEALEAAHERGIVHRDLKPANIKVTPDGTAKVLDFGIAKAIAGDPDVASADDLPTVTGAGTRGGGVFGTPAYMSPEQARGQIVDRRTDLWAFGCVLYEMLTGRSAFGRETPSDTAAAILERDPDWRALPIDTPPSIRTLLKRCLEKDKRQRLDSAAAARLEIADAFAGDQRHPEPASRRWGALAATAARWQVSQQGGGSSVRWSRDGKELFYLDPSDTMMAVRTTATGTSFNAEPPRKLFDASFARTDGPPGFDVATDGRFLMSKPETGPAGSTSSTLVVKTHALDVFK